MALSSGRSAATELMDGPDVDYETLQGCLRDLARVNVLSGGYRPTLTFLERLRRQGRLGLGRPVEVLSEVDDITASLTNLLARQGSPSLAEVVMVFEPGVDQRER